MAVTSTGYADKYFQTPLESSRMAAIAAKIGPDDDVRQNVISMRDAIKISDMRAQGQDYPPGLSDNQKKLVDLVSESRKGPLGRTLTDKAASTDSMLAVDNNVSGSGYYLGGSGPTGKLITVELKDNGKADGVAVDFSQTNLNAVGHGSLTHTFLHELSHHYQDAELNVKTPAPAMSEWNNGLVRLANESQADMIADLAQEQIDAVNSGKPVPVHTAEDLRARFENYFKENSAFHTKSYEIGKKKMDGVEVSSADFAAYFSKRFGEMPGAEKSFLNYQSRGDIYRSLVQAPHLREAFFKAAGDSKNPQALKNVMEMQVTPGTVLPGNKTVVADAGITDKKIKAEEITPQPVSSVVTTASDRPAPIRADRPAGGTGNNDSWRNIGQNRETTDVIPADVRGTLAGVRAENQYSNRMPSGNSYAAIHAAFNDPSPSDPYAALGQYAGAASRNIGSSGGAHYGAADRVETSPVRERLGYELRSHFRDTGAGDYTPGQHSQRELALGVGSSNLPGRESYGTASPGAVMPERETGGGTMNIIPVYVPKV